MAYLLYSNGSSQQRPKKFVLTKFCTKIGSQVDVDLKMPGMDSRTQIHILQRPLANKSTEHKKFIVKAVGPPGVEVKVNNTSLKCPHSLENHDKVTVGKYTFVFNTNTPNPKDDYTTPKKSALNMKTKPTQLLHQVPSVSGSSIEGNKIASSCCMHTPTRTPKHENRLDKLLDLQNAKPQYSPSIRKFYQNLNPKSSQILKRIEQNFPDFLTKQLPQSKVMSEQSTNN